MARTQEDIEEDLRAVRCAMREMLSTKEGSVGLRNILQIAERTEQGMRPTYAQLAARERNGRRAPPDHRARHDDPDALRQGDRAMNVKTVDANINAAGMGTILIDGKPVTHVAPSGSPRKRDN